MIRFVVTLLLISAVLQLDSVIEDVRQPYCELLARSLGSFFSLTGMEVWQLGASIRSASGTGLTVIPDCDGLILIALFLSGVVAVPLQQALSPYVKALAIVGLLIALNWLRLLLLAMVGFFEPGLFEMMHGYVVQGVLILISVGLFFAWLDSIMVEEPSAAPSFG